MTTFNVTQTGKESWIQGSATNKVTAVQTEVWSISASSVKFTTVYVEIWMTTENASLGVPAFFWFIE